MALNADGRDANTLKDNLATTRALFKAVHAAAESVAPRLDQAIDALQAQEKRCA